jgi:zinc transporter ZupT
MRNLQTVALLVLAVLVASWLVRADSRTDDTGIIAGLVLLFAAAFSFTRPRRFWAWGLFWGLCIPISGLLRYLFGGGNDSPATVAQSLLALVPAFLGAAIGAGIRNMMTGSGPAGGER